MAGRPSTAREEPGVTYDQEIVWDLFTNYIDAALVLGIDVAYRTKVEAMRDRLLVPKIGQWGAVAGVGG